MVPLVKNGLKKYIHQMRCYQCFSKHNDSFTTVSSLYHENNATIFRPLLMNLSLAFDEWSFRCGAVVSTTAQIHSKSLYLGFTKIQILPAVCQRFLLVSLFDLFNVGVNIYKVYNIQQLSIRGKTFVDC